MIEFKSEFKLSLKDTFTTIGMVGNGISLNRAIEAANNKGQFMIAECFEVAKARLN